MLDIERPHLQYTGRDGDILRIITILMNYNKSFKLAAGVCLVGNIGMLTYFYC